jgi:hypothetical protein
VEADQQAQLAVTVAPASLGAGLAAEPSPVAVPLVALAFMEATAALVV